MKNRFLLLIIALCAFRIAIAQVHISVEDPQTWATQELLPYVGQTVIFDVPMVVCSNDNGYTISTRRLFSETNQGPFAERILPSLFQSVTLRTAGFNTMNLNGVSGGGQALMILWMLVGGSPGSTAGGMKTTTGAVLLLTAVAIFRRKDHVTCFGRRIGEDVVRNAVAILMMYFLMFFAGGMIISKAEGLPLMSSLFETASALGTVGLSLGITGGLGSVSRLILVALMFMGRVGGLTLIYAAQSVKRSPCCTLPLEKVTVG